MASHGEESSVSRVSKASTRLHHNRLEPLVLHVLSPSNGESKKEFPIDAATRHRGYKKHFFLSLAVAVVAIIVSALMWQVSTACVTFRQNNATSTIVSYNSFCLRNNSNVMGNSVWILQWVNKANAGGKWLMNITWDVVKLMPRLTTVIGAKVYAWACDEPIRALKWFLFDARVIAKWVWWVIEMPCHYIYFFCIYINSAVAEGYHGNLSSEPNKTLIEWIGAVLEYFFWESSTSTLQTAAESSMSQMESPYQSLSVKSVFQKECAAGQPRNSADDARSHEQSEMCSQLDKSEEEDSAGQEKEEEEGGQAFLRVWRWLITAERPRGQTKYQEPQASSISDTSGDYASSFDSNVMEDDGSMHWFSLLRDLVTGGSPPTMVSEFTSGGLQEKDAQEGSRGSTDKTAGDVVTIPNELHRTEKDSVSLVTEPIVTHHRVGTTGSAADAGGVTKPNDAGHTIAKDVTGPLHLTSSSSAVVEKADPQCEGLVCAGHLDLGSASRATEKMDEKFNGSVLPERLAVWSHAKKGKSEKAVAAGGGGGGGDSISSLPISQENAGLCEVTMHGCARDLDEHEKGCQHRIADAVNLESQRTQKVFDASMAEKMRQFQSKCELVTAVAVNEERERVQRQCRKHESEELELERQRLKNISRLTSSTNACVQEQNQLSTSATFEKEREILMSQCNVSTTKALEVQAQELQKACEESTRIMFENEKEDWMKQCHLATARTVEESVYALRLQNDQTAVEERVQLQEECQQTTSVSVEKMKQETEERCKAQILSVVHETTQGLVQECHENTTRAIAREVQTLREENERAQTKFIEEERRLLEAQCEQRTREALHLQSEKLRVELNESMARTLHDLQQQQQQEKEKEEEREELPAACGDMTTAAVAAEGHRLDVRSRPATGEDLFPQRAENELLCSRALESLQIKADADCVAQLNEAHKENHTECNVEAQCEELRGKVNQGILMQVALFASIALCVVFGVYALLLRKQLRNITADAISSNASYAKCPSAKSFDVKFIDKGASSDDDTITGIPEKCIWHCDKAIDPIPLTATDSAIVSCDSLSRNTEFFAALMSILRRIYVAYLNSREVHYVELLDSIIMHEATVAQLRLLETRHHQQLHDTETAASLFVEGEQRSMMIGCAIITECRYRSELVAHEAHRRAALQCRAVAALTAEITRLAACGERPRGEHYEKSTQTGHTVNDDNSDDSEVGKEGLAEVMRDMLLAENRARHMLQLQLKLMRCRDVPSLCAPLPVAQPRSSRPFLSPLYEGDVPAMGSARLSPEMPGSASQGRAVGEATIYSGRNEAHR